MRDRTLVRPVAEASVNTAGAMAAQVKYVVSLLLFHVHHSPRALSLLRLKQ